MVLQILSIETLDTSQNLDLLQILHSFLKFLNWLLTQEDNLTDILLVEHEEYEVSLHSVDPRPICDPIIVVILADLLDGAQVRSHGT